MNRIFLLGVWIFVACATVPKNMPNSQLQKSLNTAGVTTTGNGSIDGILIAGSEPLGEMLTGPFPNAKVYLFEDGKEGHAIDSTMTDSSGEFHFNNVKPFLYTVSADQNNMAGGLVSEVVALANQSQQIEIGMQPYIEHVIHISVEDSLTIASLDLGFFPGHAEELQDSTWKIRTLPQQNQILRLGLKAIDGKLSLLRFLWSGTLVQPVFDETPNDHGVSTKASIQIITGETP